MRLYIETLGCPKNSNDSEAAAGICEKAGMTIVSDPWEADAILVNTCAFINDAKTESIDTVFDMSRLIESRVESGCDTKPLLIVSGCLSQRYGEELAEALPEVDIFTGVNDYERLPEIIRRKDPLCISGSPETFNEFSERKIPEGAISATLRIAEGCNNCCAYCVIPQIRGGYRSRPMDSILEEAERLADRGIRELILIAQDVTEYGRDIYGELKLPELLEKLCRLCETDRCRGIKWIRLMYCYEDKITDELIDVMAREKRICNYIDIPLQHISNNVLNAMRRRSDEKGIRKTIERLRKAIPDIHIRTTFITGFPGESQDDFEKLADFAEEIRFERLGVFPYSREEGTAAGNMENQIDEEVKCQRADSIMRMQVEISRQVNEFKVGKTYDVLVEGIDESGAYIGRTEYDAPEIDNNVIFTSEGETFRPGDFAEVTITDAFDYDITCVVKRK